MYVISPLIRKLLKEPYYFEFVKLVYLLEGLDQCQSVKKSQELWRSIDFKTRIFFSASPSDVGGVSIPPSFFQEKETPPVWHQPPPFLKLGMRPELYATFAVPTAVKSKIEVYVNFLGLAGIQGSLPIPYTEMILENARRKDYVMQDFLDIFNGRFLGLFYQIAQKKFPTLTWKRPQETVFGKILLSLSGVYQFRKRISCPRALLQATPFFWKSPRNAQGLVAFLKTFFEIPVKIEMFEGIWVMIPHVEKSYLAQKNTILGTNLTLGQRVYCQDYGISVQLYTKNVTQFTMFLPNGLYYSFLKQMICLYVGLKFFVSIGLHIDHPPQGRMGRRQEFPLMLGWTSFLKPLSKERQNAFQVRYH